MAKTVKEVVCQRISDYLETIEKSGRVMTDYQFELIVHIKDRGAITIKDNYPQKYDIIH